MTPQGGAAKAAPRFDLSNPLGSVVGALGGDPDKAQWTAAQHHLTQRLPQSLQGPVGAAWRGANQVFSSPYGPGLFTGLAGAAGLAKPLLETGGPVGLAFVKSVI
jgi:uncharacterized protein YaaW (UPF0174 family)